MAGMVIMFVWLQFEVDLLVFLIVIVVNLHVGIIWS